MSEEIEVGDENERASSTEHEPRQTETDDGNPAGGTGDQEPVDSGGDTGRIRNALKRLGLTGRRLWVVSGITLACVLVLMGLLSLIWSREPAHFDVKSNAEQMARRHGHEPGVELPRGYTTTATLLRVARTLLNKGGGYLGNDMLPPASLMDDMPAWEFGVLTQVRACVRALHEGMAGGPGPGVPDPDIEAAMRKFDMDHDSWLFSSSESAYREGIVHLEQYLQRLEKDGPGGARFSDRAEDLARWLTRVEKSLGTLSRRLGASVDPDRPAMDQAGAISPGPGTSGRTVYPRTPWSQIDDIFYEARGTGWALVHILTAVSVDFEPMLAQHQALETLRQVIHDIEGTQRPISSPMVMNGSEFGLFANHSLVMSSYLSRADTGLIQLLSRLERQR